MKLKKILKYLVLSAIIVCLCIGSAAASEDMMRASGSINVSISSKSGVTVGDSFFLVPGETVSYDCTYTPKSASVDFGFIAPDGLFYSINSTTGSINKTIRVSQRGSYTLAIWNNSDVAVTVTGTVNY